MKGQIELSQEKLERINDLKEEDVYWEEQKRCAEGLIELLLRDSSVQREELYRFCCENYDILPEDFAEVWERAIRKIRERYDSCCEKSVSNGGRLMLDEAYRYGAILKMTKEEVDIDIEKQKGKKIKDDRRSKISKYLNLIIIVLGLVSVVFEIFTIGWWTLLAGPFTFGLFFLIGSSITDYILKM